MLRYYTKLIFPFLRQASASDITSITKDSSCDARAFIRISLTFCSLLFNVKVRGWHLFSVIVAFLSLTVSAVVVVDAARDPSLSFTLSPKMKKS